MPPPFRFVKRADAFLNTKTGMYVQRGDPDFEKLVIYLGKKWDKQIKRLDHK